MAFKSGNQGGEVALPKEAAGIVSPLGIPGGTEEL